VFFTHEFASASRRREVKEPSGTLKRVLTITARMELDPRKPNTILRKIALFKWRL